MNHQHSDRQLTEYHQDPRFRRLLLASIGVHLAVVLLFSGVLLPRFQRDLRPVYHVDLVNLPVMNPQAGRPDARPEPAKAPAKPAAPEPVKAAPPEAPPKPAAKPEAVKLARPEPAKPVAVQPKKPEAAPVKTREKQTATEDAKLQERFRQIQAKLDRENLKQRLDEMAASQGAAVPGAPVGMPDGKGNEPGTDEQTWIKAFLQNNWALSEYQVGGRLDLVATVRIEYGAAGNLIDYRITKASGDVNFDESVKKAILKEKQLPFRPGRTLDLKNVEFNLKELMNRR